MQNLTTIQKTLLNLYLKEVKSHNEFKIETNIDGLRFSTNYNSYSFNIFKSMILDFIKGDKRFYDIETSFYVPKDKTPDETTYTSAYLRLTFENTRYYFSATKY
jgi:hypothetical protein